jgi:phosphoglycerol transferase
LLGYGELIMGSFCRKFLFTTARWLFPLLLCSGILIWTLKLWKADLRIPFFYAGDGFYYQLYAKGILDDGWNLHNRHLSYPGELDMEDFPLPDNLHLLFFKLLAQTTNHFGTIINWYYLLTFPLTTLTTFIVFRRFQVSYFTSVVGSILYAFIPYHFSPGEGHLFLVAYFLIPLVVMLAINIYQGGNLVKYRDANEESDKVRCKPPGVLASLAICLAVGSASIYHAFFSCFLLLAAGICGTVLHQRRKVLAMAILLVTVISLTCLANLSPTCIYNWQHGFNPDAMVRNVADAETFSLKINNLVLPPPDFRLARFIHPACTLGSTFGTYLGLVGSLGFLILIGHVFIPRGGQSPTLMGSLSLLNLASVILGSVGSFSFLLAVFATPWIRCYYRLNVFLAFMGIFAAVFLLEQLRHAYFQTAFRRWLFQIGLVGILFVGIWDQTNRHFIPDYTFRPADFQSDREFIRSIEARIPGEAVFQLPYSPFPEGSSFEHLRGYLHSQSLRWSGGAMKGRPVDIWQRGLCVQPLETMLQSIALAGFKGIYIDRFGYADRAQKLESELTCFLEKKPMLSANQRLIFFDLTNYANDLRAGWGDTEWELQRKQVMAPLSIWPVWKKGFYHWEGIPEDDWRWCSSNGQLEIYNFSPHPKRVSLEMGLSCSGTQSCRLHIKCDWFDETLSLVGQSILPFQRELVLPHGRSSISFVCDGQKFVPESCPRDMVFIVRHFRLKCLESPDQNGQLVWKDGTPLRKRSPIYEEQICDLPSKSSAK